MLLGNEFDRKRALDFTEQMYVDSVRQMCWILSEESLDYGVVIESYWHTLLFLANKKTPKNNIVVINTKGLF